MKKFQFSALILLFSFLFLLSNQFANALGKKNLNSSNNDSHNIIAKVANRVITNYDLEERIKIMKFLNNIDNSMLTKEDEAYIRQEALELLIEEKIAELEAARLSFDINQNDLDALLTKISAMRNTTVKELMDSLQNYDKKNFLSYLRGRNILSQFVEHYIKPTLSATQTEIEGSRKIAEILIENNMKMQQTLEENKTINLDDEIEIAEIVLQITDNTNNMEKEKILKQTIQDIYQKLKNGEDFAKLAEKHSVNPSTSSNGGKIGKIKLGELDKVYIQILQNKNIGQICEPIQIGDKIIILKLLDVQKNVQKTNETATKSKSNPSDSDKNSTNNTQNNNEKNRLHKTKTEQPQIQKSQLHDLVMGQKIRLLFEQYLQKMKSHYLVEIISTNK